MTSCWNQKPSARPSAWQIYVGLLSEVELERFFEIRGGGGDNSSARTIKALESERDALESERDALESERDTLLAKIKILEDRNA